MRKIGKKVLVLVCMLMCMVCFCGCGSGSNNAESITSDEDAEQSTERTAIVETQKYTLNDVSFEISDNWIQDVDNSDSSCYWFRSNEDNLLIKYEIIPDVLKIDTGDGNAILSEADVIEHYTHFHSAEITKKETVEISGCKAYDYLFTTTNGKYGREFFIPINSTEKYFDLVIISKEQNSLSEIDRIIDSSNLDEILQDIINGEESNNVKDNESDVVTDKPVESFEITGDGVCYVLGEMLNEQNGSYKVGGKDGDICLIYYDSELVGGIGFTQYDSNNYPKQYTLMIYDIKNTHEELELYSMVYMVMMADNSLDQHAAVSLITELTESASSTGSSSKDLNGVNYMMMYSNNGEDLVMTLIMTDKSE